MNRFHNFDPWDMLAHMDLQLKLISNNCLEVAKAHNQAQHYIDILTLRANEQQQEILELKADLERITNNHGVMSGSA
jgi:hypothetical protein